MSESTVSGWIDVAVADVRRSEDDDPTRRFHVVILDEKDGTRTRRLPALALNLEAAEMPRPMTYQLAANLVAGAGAAITEIRITWLEEGPTTPWWVLQGQAGPVEVDARPSDALNLALVMGAVSQSRHLH